MAAASDKPREDFRSFTVRVPQSLYIQMGSLAASDKMFLNQKVNQLLKLGMGQHVNVEDMLVRLLRTKITEERDNG
jgi:hypothetical protein